MDGPVLRFYKNHLLVDIRYGKVKGKGNRTSTWVYIFLLKHYYK